MEIGKLYKIKQYFWLMFPNKETAVASHPGRAPGGHDRTADLAADCCAYWSKRFNCTVSYVSPGDTFVFLEKDGMHKKILSTDGTLGWTWCDDSWNDSFEEARAE